MLGIQDPRIWMVYLLAFLCLAFAVWFGITHWNKDSKEDE